MKLSVEQMEMLEGKKGEVLKLAMEIVCSYGESVGAECLVPITSAHIAGNYTVIGDEGVEWLEAIVNSGGRAKVFCTKNPEMFEFGREEELGIPEQYRVAQERIRKVMHALGVIPFYSCHHYLLGNLPRFGEHIAWASSGSQVFANSLLGARSNRDADHAVIAAALTGFVPLWGLHLQENRKADIIVDLQALPVREMDVSDFKALGWSLGKIIGGRIPVFVGLPSDIGTESIKALLYTLTVTGSTGLVHVSGITPEAPTAEAVVRGRISSCETIVARWAMVRQAYEEISTTAKTADVDAVIFGCPHCTIHEIQEIAECLAGRRIHTDCSLWISTSKWVKTLCERIGLYAELESLGVKVIADTETATGLTLWLKEQGVRAVATNSARACFYAHNVVGVQVLFGNTKQCVEAAVTGKWRA